MDMDEYTVDGSMFVGGWMGGWMDGWIDGYLGMDGYG